MSRRYYNDHDDRPAPGWGTIIIGIILLVFLSVSMRSCSREQAHMIYIGDGYVYHEDSHIIYIENDAGRYEHTVYTVYYDSDGKMNRYDEESGEWIPVG